jgi:hypothetical protein
MATHQKWIAEGSTELVILDMPEPATVPSEIPT